MLLICELALRTMPNEYSTKWNNFIKTRKDIELLILGNSHALRTINPNEHISKEHQKTVLEIIKNVMTTSDNIEFLDLNNEEIVDLSHFADSDHLNSKGAALYTNLMEEKLDVILKK